MTFNAGIEAAALLPCPFCGSTSVNTGFQRDGRVVGCCGCGARMGAHHPDAEEKAREKWNTRPSFSAPVEQREAVARDDKLLAICRVLKPNTFSHGLKPLESDGPSTSATITDTVYIAGKILDAILSLPGSSRDEKALRDEIMLLRNIVRDVRVMANAGAFKEFEGEPWLMRARNIDLNHDPVATEK